MEMQLIISTLWQSHFYWLNKEKGDKIGGVCSAVSDLWPRYFACVCVTAIPPTPASPRTEKQHIDQGRVLKLGLGLARVVTRLVCSRFSTESSSYKHKITKWHDSMVYKSQTQVSYAQIANSLKTKLIPCRRQTQQHRGKRQSPNVVEQTEV